MDAINEGLIVGVDFSPDHTPVMSVGKLNDGKFESINIIQGDQAIRLYNELTGKKRGYSIRDKKLSVVVKDSIFSVTKKDIHGKGQMERCPRCGQALDWESYERV